jgi:anti-anti-sigma factor
VRILGGPGKLWTGEGYFIQDLFEARGEGPVYADKHLLVTRTAAPPGLRLAGEIDMTNSDAVMDCVKTAFPDGGDHHLDLSALSFCDISGIRGLIEIATERGDGRRLLLHGLPEQLQTVLRVTGWSDLPNLAICACRAAPNEHRS